MESNVKIQFLQIILLGFIYLAGARYTKDVPTLKVAALEEEEEVVEPIAVIRDDRHYGDDGSYSISFEGENGIKETRDGSLGHQQGTVR